MQQESLAHPAQPSTRELRGLQLYKDHADDIRHADGIWFIPSQHDAITVFEVIISRRGESCECSDFEYRGYACKHIFAAVVARAKTAPCSGCGDRFRHRDLTEIGDDHLSLFEGELLCQECAADHGVL